MSKISLELMDLFTIIPGIGAAIIAIRNWWALRRGAVIFPNKILSYGIVRDDPNEPQVKNFYIPIIFHNEGTNVGMITKVEILFYDGNTTKRLPIISKIKLRELTDDQVNLGRQYADMVTFDEKGYIIQIPMYPISVPAGESTQTMFFCVDYREDDIVKLDKELTCIIRIEYGRNKTREIKFPFILTKEDFNGTDLVRWFKPQAGNMREQFPGDYE